MVIQKNKVDKTNNDMKKKEERKWKKKEALAIVITKCN